MSSETITSVVELAVGLGCLAAAAGSWRRPSLRWVAALLLVAGPAAVIHAALEHTLTPDSSSRVSSSMLGQSGL